MKIDYRHEFRFKVRFEMIPACRVQHSRGIYTKNRNNFLFSFITQWGKFFRLCCVHLTLWITTFIDGIFHSIPHSNDSNLNKSILPTCKQ